MLTLVFTGNPGIGAVLMYGERYYSSPVAGTYPYYNRYPTPPPPVFPYAGYPPPPHPYYPPSPYDAPPYAYEPQMYERRGEYKNDFAGGMLGACLGCCVAYLLCCCLDPPQPDCYGC
ncbi:UV-induced protein uvi15 [Trichostrongylus colubriformis]|uniref:UV-induced protein uvi15 n=1 Tax=Trichostrongylus colubriformis TaxID=6319 RepID=A0AAN8FQL0_TRICO